MMRSNPAHVAHYLSKLGRLCAGSMSLEAAVEKAEAYAPLLAREFPAEAFTPDCLATVAAQCKFFPAYGELVGYIRAWWRDNKPFLPALPGPTQPDRIPPTEEEKAVVTALTRAAVGVLQEAAAEKLDTAERRCGIRPSYMSDDMLLRTYEAQAASGNPAAAVRVEHLRRKLGVTEGVR